MKKIFKFCIFLILTSCNNVDFYKDMETCINLSYKENFSFENESVSIIDSIGKYEAYLIQSSLLKDITKKSYDVLIEYDLEKDELGEIINFTKSEMPFYYEYNINSIIKGVIYDACPHRIIRSGGVSKEFYDIKKVYEKLFAEGTTKKYILKELSSKTNYKNKVSRLLLCNLIYLSWKEEYIRGLPDYIDISKDSAIFK